MKTLDMHELAGGELEDLILQRTGAFIQTPGGRDALAIWATSGRKEVLREHLEKTGMTQWYLDQTVAEINSEADEIISMLGTPDLSSMVSIGPGNGLLEAALITRCPANKLLLVDIEESDSHHHGYNLEGSGYASLIRTKTLIATRCQDTVNILTCNPEKMNLPEIKFTFLISTLSMGFHYPCTSYVKFLTRNASGNAMVIFDLRRGCTDAGFDALLKFFTIEAISEHAKYRRLFLRGKER